MTSTWLFKDLCSLRGTLSLETPESMKHEKQRTAIEVAEKAERTREKDAKRKKRFLDKQRAARKARERGG